MYNLYYFLFTTFVGLLVHLFYVYDCYSFSTSTELTFFLLGFLSAITHKNNTIKGFSLSFIIILIHYLAIYIKVILIFYNKNLYLQILSFLRHFLFIFPWQLIIAILGIYMFQIAYKMLKKMEAHFSS
jgi:hypothetical protein